MTGTASGWHLDRMVSPITQASFILISWEAKLSLKSWTKRTETLKEEAIRSDLHVANFVSCTCIWYSLFFFQPQLQRINLPKCDSWRYTKLIRGIICLLRVRRLLTLCYSIWLEALLAPNKQFRRIKYTNENRNVHKQGIISLPVTVTLNSQLVTMAIKTKEEIVFSRQWQMALVGHTVLLIPLA